MKSIIAPCDVTAAFLKIKIENFGNDPLWNIYFRPLRSEKRFATINVVPPRIRHLLRCRKSVLWHEAAHTAILSVPRM